MLQNSKINVIGCGYYLVVYIIACYTAPHKISYNLTVNYQYTEPKIGYFTMYL